MSTLAKIVLDTKEVKDDISFIPLDSYSYPPDFHVTCTYKRRNEHDVEKEAVIDWCEHMISSSNGNNDVDVTVDGIYQGMGTIFMKVVNTVPIVPRPASQILHITLLVDYANDSRPKNALYALQNNSYKLLSSFNKTYKGILVLSK